MSYLEKFNKDITDLISHFLNSFEEWVKDFEDFAQRRKKYSSISPKFLEKRALSLIEAFDKLLDDLDTTYSDIVLEYNKLDTVEKKNETKKLIVKFKSKAIKLIQRANVKAEVLLHDFLVSPFNSESKKQLEKIENFTYDDFLKYFEDTL